MKLQQLVGKYFFAFCFATWDQVSSGLCIRPCKKCNNPKIGVAEFMKTNSDFAVDQAIDEKLLISAAPGGYLKRIKQGNDA